MQTQPLLIDDYLLQEYCRQANLSRECLCLHLDLLKSQYYLLLQNVLGQDMRDGYATGGIVRGMADLKDAKRGLNIVKITKAIYETKWGKEPGHPSQQFLLNELGKMEAHLTPRAKQQARKEARSTLRIKKP